MADSEERRRRGGENQIASVMRTVAETESTTGRLKAPFPYFGGKSRVAHLVWDRFGNVANYVEPFAGSLAVLLNRPHAPGVETVNDIDCYLANFWRSVHYDPDTTASYADWPVNEADLHARHRWLVDQVDFRERMKTEPDYYDAKVAGWWVWGLCQWIGSGWCEKIQRQMPHLGDAGQGINRKLPHLGYARRGIRDYFRALSFRLRRVRVCCGSWDRVLGASVTFKHGVTGVFLDPPYGDGRDAVYANESFTIAGDVREWAIANGNNPDLRIALCGYDGEHEMPSDWECVAWKAAGGYGSQLGRENAGRERIWFSPHCLKSPSLFEDAHHE